jgi:hypothetical protein
MKVPFYIQKQKFKILYVKPERKGLLGRSMLRWKDSIKTARKQGMGLIHLSQHRVQWCALLNTIMKEDDSSGM